MDEEPIYAFTLPSLHDGLRLDCRLYASQTTTHVHRRGVVIGHPYAPLGGSYDDIVVLSLTSCLLEQGFVVATFNFRGAGESQGRSSWTGRGEIEDYESAVGMLVYYLDHINHTNTSEHSNSKWNLQSPFTDTKCSTQPLQLLLAGYSYGALVLARLPPVATLVQRFERAERGSSAAEIILRARTLAKQTLQTAREVQSTSPRMQSVDEPSPSSRRGSPVTLGGEESQLSDRRRRSDSSVIREIPQRIKQTIQRHSEHLQKVTSGTTTANPSFQAETAGPVVEVQYLLVSPVLLPMTAMLAPVGVPLLSGQWIMQSKSPQEKQEVSGFLSRTSPTLVIFGSEDSFTSSKRLRQWAEKLVEEASGRLAWVEIEGAGHFWREPRVFEALTKRLNEWTCNALPESSSKY